MSKKHTKRLATDAAPPIPAPQIPTDPGMRAVFDAFQNMAARTGFGTPSLLETTQYPLTRMSQNYILMNALYRGSWIVRKIIDMVVGDCTKNWYSIVSQIEPDWIDRYQRLERTTKTKKAICDAWCWARLYGGAAAVMMIQGHEKILAEPLDYDDIIPNSYKGLLVLDRWSGITPSSEQITDISSPDFGQPASYHINTETGASYQVHASRVLRFVGRKLPFWERTAEVQWGESEIEVVYEELKKRDNTSYNIANLIFLACIKVFKMKGMSQILSSASPAILQNVYNNISSLNQMMSSQGMALIGDTDDLVMQTYSFNGINDVYESFMLDMAGAAEIPVTKLFGRAPAGMNATGESDLANYDSHCEQLNEEHLSPVLDKLTPVMALSEFGEVPEDWDYRFNPVRTPTADKLAELVERKSNAVNVVFLSGIIPRKTALQELRQLSDETGMFTNITDEMIDTASDQVDEGQMGEFGGSGEPGTEPPEDGTDRRSVADKAFEEADHPREDDGKFGSGGGGGAKLAA